MLRCNEIRRFAAQTGSAGMLATLLATLLAASMAEAALPTGGMLLPRPKGPSRSDLPSSTSTSAYRVPSATAYGITGSCETSADGHSPAVASRESGAKVTANLSTGDSSHNRPLIQPRVAAPEEAAQAFSALTPVTIESFDRNPFDASIAAAPVTFADQREPGDAKNSRAGHDGAFAGLKGICPVTLREERRVVTPRPEFSSLFGGCQFEFATTEAKAAFDASPERYAPVLGGRDVVLTATGAEEAIGSLKHAGFYRQRLYLFSTDESCKSFYENPRRFAVGE